MSEPVLEHIVEPIAVPEQEIVPEPVALAPEVPVLVEKRHEYQPVDDQGRAIGGKQVIIYHTEHELVEKLTKNHIESIKAMRDSKRKQRLGISDDEGLPSDIERMPAAIQLRDRELTLEERYAISQDLNDPQKFDEARDRLIESGLGAKPKDIRDTINNLQLTTQQLLARSNAQTWLERHPEFYNCEENLSTVVDWMVKNGLQPTVKNFEIAQNKMSEAGLLLSSPIVREVPPAVPAAETVPKPQAPVVEPVRINEAPLPQENRNVARIPSGLNARVSSGTGVAIPTGSAALTLKDIDNMPSTEYKQRLLTDPAFVKRVNELMDAQPPKPRRA